MTHPINYHENDTISKNTVKVIAIMALVSIIPTLSLVMALSNSMSNQAVKSSPQPVERVSTDAVQVEKPVNSIPYDIARKNIESVLSVISPDASVNEIQLVGSGGIYRVSVNGNDLYFSGDADVMLAGNAFGTRDGREYTTGYEKVSAGENSARINSDIPNEEVELSVVDEQPVVSTETVTADQGSYKRFPETLAILTGDIGAPIQVAVFTDPDCPFCRQLEQLSGDLKGVELANMLYPIEELHPGATEISNKIWCSDDPESSFRAYMVDGDKSALADVSTNCETPIENIAKAAARAGVNGTPTFLTVDGRVLEGYPGRDEFMKWVNNDK